MQTSVCNIDTQSMLHDKNLIFTNTDSEIMIKGSSFRGNYLSLPLKMASLSPPFSVI